MIKRSLTLNGHRTSVALEAPFWQALEDIAHQQSLSLPALVARIDRTRSDNTSLSSALRVFALQQARQTPPETANDGRVPLSKPAIP